jgi:predicted PurR-regulated permease PerM
VARAREPRVTATEGSLQVAIAPRTLVTLVSVSLGAVLLLALVYAARAVLIQLIVAVMLAMALEPFVQLLERRGLRRGRAVGITFGLAVLAAAGFAYLLIPPLVDEVTSFSHHAPDLLTKLTKGHGRLGFLETRFHVVERARSWIAAHGNAVVAGPGLSAAGAVLRTGAGLFAILFLTLFVGLGGRKWFDASVELLPEESRGRWRRAGSGVATAVGGYVTGNLLISVVAGTFTTIICLAAGVPFAVPLGLVVGLFDLIPLVGATLGTVFVALVALTKGVPTMVIVVAAMWLYQKIENHTLVPLVYHRTVQLSPLAVAVAAAAGAEIGGIPGALLAIPIAGAIKVVGREVIAWRRGEDPVQAVETRATPELAAQD